MKRKIALSVLMVVAIITFAAQSTNANPWHRRGEGRFFVPHVRVFAPPVVVVPGGYGRGYVRPHCYSYARPRYYGYKGGCGHRGYYR